MRIWIVNQYAVPPSQPGITRHHQLARSLLALGHEVAIIASSFDHLTRRETRLAAGENHRLAVEDHVPFLWLRTPPYPGNTAARIWNMGIFAARVWAGQGLSQLPRPDVIVGSSPHLFGAHAAERQAARLGVPFVLEVRDLWPQSLIELGAVSARHPVVRGLERLERRLYRRASRIVTLLPGAEAWIAERGAAPEAIAWVPNGVDLGQLPRPTPAAERPFLTVMYAGSHGLANGLDQVLEAAALLESEGWAERVRFRLVGDGPAKAALIDRARTMGLRSVTFEPPVPKSGVFELLADADACLMLLKPSPLFRWGLSPNKLFDYMAAARPVIFSADCPYNPVEEARAGLTVQPGDAGALAEAVKRMAGLDRETRLGMGQRARQYVERHHDLEALTRRFEATLAAAARERPHGRLGEVRP